jgi:hypothetical protein
MSEGHDRERHVHRLLGRPVYDRSGRPVGHLEELHAEKEGDYYVVAAFDLGPVAMLERLAVRHLGVSWAGRPHGYRARWNQIDLEDERRMTLTCEVDELEKLGPRQARKPPR